LVQIRGGREVQTGGILLYFEDLNRAPDKEIGPKDFFEMTSKQLIPKSYISLANCLSKQNLDFADAGIQGNIQDGLEYKNMMKSMRSVL
jgi:hypothetical protein